MKMLKLGKTMGSQSHIVPYIVGENDKTVELSEILFQNGYFTLPIRPPTVPAGTSRLRLSLTTDITDKDLQKLQEILKQKI
jgi:8-amino-7-oxononanoate synthase